MDNAKLEFPVDEKAEISEKERDAFEVAQQSSLSQAKAEEEFFSQFDGQDLSVFEAELEASNSKEFNAQMTYENQPDQLEQSQADRKYHADPTESPEFSADTKATRFEIHHNKDNTFEFESFNNADELVKSKLFDDSDEAYKHQDQLQDGVKKSQAKQTDLKEPAKAVNNPASLQKAKENAHTFFIVENEGGAEVRFLDNGGKLIAVEGSFTDFRGKEKSYKTLDDAYFKSNAVNKLLKKEQAREELAFKSLQFSWLTEPLRQQPQMLPLQRQDEYRARQT